jgi:hypothetical protein
MAVMAWILIPNIFNPYVRVPSDTFRFALDCAPESVDVVMHGVFAVASQARVESPAGATSGTALNLPLTISSLSGKGELPRFRLGADTSAAAAISNYLSARNGPPTLIYSIAFERLPNLDIQRLLLTQGNGATFRCSEDEYKGKSLLKATLTSGATLMWYSLLQEEIGGIVFSFNNIVANVLLAAMIVGLLWHAWALCCGTKDLYVSPDASLRKKMNKLISAAPPEIKAKGAEVVRWKYTELYRRLAFAKTVGPALGFLLTVSSLSAALHPSLQSTQDTFRMVSGIQIAVVATFVGLAIRIVAQFSQRVHRSLGERYLQLLHADLVEGSKQ